MPRLLFSILGVLPTGEANQPHNLIFVYDEPLGRYRHFFIFHRNELFCRGRLGLSIHGFDRSIGLHCLLGKPFSRYTSENGNATHKFHGSARVMPSAPPLHAAVLKFITEIIPNRFLDFYLHKAIEIATHILCFGTAVPRFYLKRIDEARDMRKVLCFLIKIRAASTRFFA